MKKIILAILCFSFLTSSMSPAFAAGKTSIEYQDGKYKLKADTDTKGEHYVRIRKRDLDEIRRQAFISAGILQRIRDLETLYKQVRNIIETIDATINYVTDFLNLNEIDIFGSGSSDEFEDAAGVIMSPGFVEFVVNTTDPDSDFDSEGISELEVDIYYNKTLFSIDHLEGDGIMAEDFRIVPVSSKTSGAKDRLVIPLSDLLTNQTSFRLYLSARNADLIAVGDSTKLDIRYYKTIPKNEDGERIAPIEYSFAEGSAEEITVVVN